MSDNYRKDFCDEEEDTQGECRERRRRRIEMRRNTSALSAARMETAGRRRYRTSVEPPSSSPSSGEDADPSSSSASTGAALVAVALVSEEEQEVLPVFGTMSVAGRMREMEDRILVQTNLCRPEICGRRPVHFFAVYDGHGGAHVAELCRERLHVLLEEELMRVNATPEEDENCTGPTTSHTDQQEEEEEEERWRRVLINTFRTMDDVTLALSTCSCGFEGYHGGCRPMALALAGSTATVAILTPSHIIVANCGDSRAVLCRGGNAMPLSVDHKPDRPDELARIKDAGGRVIFVEGARVEGILAMSRAIGDKFLKTFVISEPEITFTKRDPEDECLIVASDGLWDVVSSQLACEVARGCLEDMSASERACMDTASAPPLTQSALAAALLTRLALGRKSTDNISVLAVDLKSR